MRLRVPWIQGDGYMTATEIYDQTIKDLPVSERLQLAKLIIDDISN